MGLYLEIAGNQIDGARDYQEDAFMITHLGEGEDANAVALVIMADGMGGHAAGNVASNMVTSTFNKSFTGSYPTDDIPGALKEALLKSNDVIASAVKETPGLKGMGCTMVTALVNKDMLWWVSVGDSHLYIVRDRELIKKNADHSYGGYLQMMREQGIDVDPDPKLSPNMLMSAMIGDDIAEIDLPDDATRLYAGDRILVASDGLDTLGQGAIIQYSAWSESPRECVKALLDAVESANQPRQDNTTIVCIDVKDRDAADRDAAADTPEEDKTETRESLESTQEMSTLEADDVTAPRAGPEEIVLEGGGIEEPPAAPPAAPVAEETRAGGGKAGLFIGIAVVLLLALAGGAYFIFAGGNGQPAPPQPVAEAPVPEPEPEPGPGPAAPVEPVKPMPPEPVAVTPEAPAKPVQGPMQLAGEVALKPGVQFRDDLKGGGQGPEMVMLAGGEFRMGGRASALAPDERPRHAVDIDPFAMSRYEVTFAEYDLFAKATGRKLPADNGWDRATHPVVNVSWDDAYAYVKWLTQQTGKRYRLASEAEWEYAARAGTTTDYWWGRKVGKENAHCFDCESGLHPRKPAKVGYFKPNPFGLYDTAGNVLEWVHDCYHPNYNGHPGDGSVWEGGDCTRRVARGGSYSSASSALRASKREKLVSNAGYDNVGIRIVRDP